MKCPVCKAALSREDDEHPCEPLTTQIAKLTPQVQKWSGWFTYTAELFGVEPTQAAVAARIAELEEGIRQRDELLDRMMEKWTESLERETEAITLAKKLVTHPYLNPLTDKW